VQVPTVLNIGFVDAARFVEERGLIADSAAVPSDALRGAVIEQIPPGGTRLARGRAVVLKVSLGAGERRPAEVPRVTGAGERSARNRLHRAGFTVHTVGRKAPKRENLGDVLLQRPAAGSFAPVLNRITIYVGR
jgi:eukaryotic-like serine/threonine-protein kinase